MALSSITEHWIRQDALTITLNVLGPDIIQASVLSGTAIAAYKNGVIGYDTGHNFRTWPVLAYATALEYTGPNYVYAKLTRSEKSPKALISYSKDEIDIEGRRTLEDGSYSEIDAEYFYIYLGKISSSVDESGNQVDRYWIDSFRFGTLGTNQFQMDIADAEWKQMFRLNKVSDVIEVLKDIASATIGKLKVLSEFIFAGKTITDIATSQDDYKTVEKSDSLLATPGYVETYSEATRVSKLHDDIVHGNITFRKNVTIEGESNVKGNSTVEGKSHVGGDVDIDGNADIQGNTSIGGDTTIHGKVNIKGNTTFGDYTEGVRGAAIKRNPDGSWKIDTDHLVVRKKATFTSLEIQDVHHIGGQQILSAARAELVYVEETNAEYKCYFLKTDGRNTIRNTWESGDLAYCNTFDVSELHGKEVQNHFYWRTVVGFGTGADKVVSVDGSDMNLSTCYYISLSKSRSATHSDVPLAGDHVVLLGHEGMNKSRCNAIVLAGAGEDSPYIAQYTNIVGFVLPEPETLIKPDENYFAGKVVVKGNGKYQGEIEDIAEQVLGEANTEADNIFKNVRYSRYNMLRNTSFTGDYLATQVNETLMSEDLELFSDPLVHWLHNNVVIEYSTESMSGYAAVLTDGTLIQPLTGQQVIKSGNKYTVSFKAKGQRIQIAAGDYHEEITLTDTMTDYIRRFEASSDVYQFGIGGNCTVCELQLSLGEAASQWGMSVLDNQNVMGLIQSFQYLTDAIKNGKTEILGGLILSDVIMCGDTPEEGETRKITSGISGQYDEADDVAFWAGGNLSEAIQLVAKMKENPRLSDEEWKNLAKFAVTHGGDVFMRGYIHALGGIFKNCLAENLQIDGGLIRAEKEIDKKSKIVITISDDMIGDANVNALTISRFYKKEETEVEYSEQPIIKLNCDSRGNTGYLQIMNNEGSNGLFSSVTMEGGAIEVEYDDRNGNTSTVTINNGAVKIVAGDDVTEIGAMSLSIGKGTFAQDSQVFLKLPLEANATQGCLCKDSAGYIKIKK